MYCPAELADLADFPNPATPPGDPFIAALSAGVALCVPTLGMGVAAAGQLLNCFSGESPPHFQFHKRRDGGKHAVIMVNGFLTKGNLDVSDWEKAIARKFGRATWYHLDWEAGRHPANMSNWVLGGGSSSTMFDALMAWHKTMADAERAGELLADAIMRTPDWRYTLLGHSLGARVIHFALKALARHPRKRIENAYLLGGAVGGGAKDDGCWIEAVSAVKENIFNCYSGNDTVLRTLYQGANAMQSEPVG